MLKRLTLLVLLCCAGVMLRAQTQGQEANLKAAFIYNFTRYIDWEKNGEPDFVIGIIGPSYVSKPLTEIAATKVVDNKKIIIRQFEKPEDISYCHILFIPKGLNYPLRSVLDKVGKGTLTVSEENGFAKQGSAFNFTISNEKLKFEANLRAIYTAGLKVSSQLLKLATIVD